MHGASLRLGYIRVYHLNPVNPMDEFVKRSVYYVSQLVAGELTRGKNYEKLKNAYQITFMNFETEPDERLHHTYMLYEHDDKKLLTDMLQVHFIELPKLKKIAEKPRETLSDIEFWSMIVFAGDEPQVKQWLSTFTEHKEELNMINALLSRLSTNRRNWAYQLSADRWKNDWASRWNSGIEHAREEGIAIGEERGMQKGIAEGSREKALEAARILKQSGVDSAIIAKSTGLTAEEIAEL